MKCRIVYLPGNWFCAFREVAIEDKIMYAVENRDDCQFYGDRVEAEKAFKDMLLGDTDGLIEDILRDRVYEIVSEVCFELGYMPDEEDVFDLVFDRYMPQLLGQMGIIDKDVQQWVLSGNYQYVDEVVNCVLDVVRAI